MEGAKKSSVPALDRGIRILELLPQSRSGLTLSQLTRHLDLPKSSVHCLLRALQDAGYVYREAETGKFHVSLRICTLADMALSGIGLRDHARPSLRRLSDTTRMTVHLAVLEQGACILIEKVSRSEGMRVATWTGKHLSLHCTSLGKALAAYIPENQLDALIREQGLLRHNDNTICSLKRLKQDLEIVRQRGYALDDEEEEISVRCIGAPIFNGRRQAVAAVSVVGAVGQIHDGNIGRLSRLVMAAAKEIGDRIAGTEAVQTSAVESAEPAADRISALYRMQ